MDTRTHSSWQNMRTRCNNPNYDHFERYGGRGINYCLSWHSFENFLADMGVRPKGKSLDRIDGDKGYSPDNCQWSTQPEQLRNRARYSNNTSKVCGVSWYKKTGQWRVRINASKSLGLFDSFLDAVATRLRAEKKYGYTPQ